MADDPDTKETQMRKPRQFPLVVSVVMMAAACCNAAEVVELARLDLTKMSSGWGRPLADQSVTGKTLSIDGTKYDRGVGTHAASVLHVELDGRARHFKAHVGVDDATQGRGTVRFRVYGDGQKLFDSGLVKGGQPARPVEVSLGGVKQLMLMVTSGSDGVDFDHADWALAEFAYDGRKPVAVDPPALPAEEKVILTPKPGPAPRINGPSVYGCRPGRPFLYRIPCTGRRPIRFAAQDLPPGLTLDSATGIVTGHAPGERGQWTATFTADNAHGRDECHFTIAVGDTLALTPPMGWNSWYIHYHHVTEQHMRNAADVMIASGMADYGYSYVNIDDCWMKKRGDEPYRDERGAILTNSKFPDIGGMVDYIHGKGLKAGLYTSPGPWTCAGYVGSYEHEHIDAEKFAEWGFDFLKYDWCSYGRVAGGKSLEHHRRPYRKMGDILKTLDRDILLNLCQYGMADVWTWGGQVGGHCWRTTGDLGLARGGTLPGFYHIGLSNARHHEYAGPGRWNDPDYILIGSVGNARSQNAPPEPTKLTPSEQYSYMSMWCLMAAPLFFSGDMRVLDEFTLSVLCNAEVIAVDQDPLGRQAKPLHQDDETLILAKPMQDGSLAVGFFNLGEMPREIAVDWSLLIGTSEGRFGTRVPRHGVMLVRLVPVIGDADAAEIGGP
jgi:alpha-galactosidase